MDLEKAAEYEDRICGAAQDFDEPSAEGAVDDLIRDLAGSETLFPLPAAKNCLGCLRNKRYFPLLQRLADALIQNGQDAPVVHRQYAQALIETRAFSAAIAVLEDLVQRTAQDGDDAENAETRGLLGRVYKQIYVDGGEALKQRERYIVKAVGCYKPVYHKDPDKHLWHGINAVALMLRAARDGFNHWGDSEATEMAGTILRTITRMHDAKAADCWEFATAMEACVATGDYDAALRWARLYVDHPDADAFELASTLRQLVDVWQCVPGSGPEGTLLGMLESQLLVRSGGALTFDQPSATRDRFAGEDEGRPYEAILGNDLYLSIENYRTGLKRCAAVAIIEDRDDPGRGFGTGFLVDARDLDDRLGERPLLLTNAHVVAPPGAYREALEPDTARIFFKAAEMPGGGVFTIRALLWSSPPDELDASLIELAEQPPTVERFSLRRPELSDKSRVYVVGHPGGNTLMQLSLNDNRVLGHKDALIHYRAPTEGGSSGSPVFDTKWRLAGLHHAGGFKMKRLDGKGFYPANEGIWIHSIRAAVSQWVDAGGEPVWLSGQNVRQR